MTIASVSILIGAFACGLVATRAQAQAQALDAPSIAGDEAAPWNRGVSVETRIAAREVFLEGNRLFNIPLFSQAVEKYTEALEQWKHPAFYFNLALTEINLSQYLEAREHLEQALKYGEAPLRTDRFREAQKQLVEVQRHLARLRVSCHTPGAEVTLDGAVLFIGPGEQEIWIKAQAHEVTAKKPEHSTQARRVTVAAGTRETVSLSLRKLVEDRPWALWKPWAVVGAGAAIAGAGGVLYAVSARNFDGYDAGFVKLGCAVQGCTEDQIDAGNPHLSPRLRRARLEQKLALGGYIAGGVVLTAGVALLYMNRPHLTEQDDASPHSAAVAIAPVVSSDLLGVTLTVSH